MSDVFEIFTIYEHPSDYREYFVVRRWFVRGKDPEAGACQLAETLEEARALVPSGLARVTRMENDDPCIVETWL